MAKLKEPSNPFFVLLLMVGLLFFVTATAYFVMTLRADRFGRGAQQGQPGNALMQFMDEHGGQLLTGELLVLGAFTFGAMATDGYWSRRCANRQIAPDSDDDQSRNV